MIFEISLGAIFILLTIANWADTNTVQVHCIIQALLCAFGGAIYGIYNDVIDT